MKTTMTAFVSLFFSCIILAQNPLHKVLIIGIDGCRSDALRAANAPNIHALLSNSVYSFDAFTHFPTWSGTGWSSMCTGVWEDKHGVFDNAFAGSNYEQYPHFFKRIETYDPSLHTVSIVHWSPINTQINTLCDLEINVPTDLEVKDAAVAYLNNNDADALFVAFDDVDHVGHANGFSPDVAAYMASIELTDSYVGEIMAALQNRPDFANEDWMVLLSTDHGGLPQGHGGASFEERNIFFIAWKPNQTPLEISKDSTVFTPDSGLQFNGTDQYLLPDNSSLFDFGDSQDFTVELRVKYTDLNGDAAFISNKNWNSGINKGWVISTPLSDQTRWKVNIADGSNRADINGGNIADGNWHHLAVTFDRDSIMQLYEDGNFIGSTNIANIGNIDAGFPLVIGQDGRQNYPYFFNGSIAEVRIWNTVLDAATIAAHTCSTLTEDHPFAVNLLAYWPVDDGNGQTIGSAISSAPNCTLQGAAAEWTAQGGSLVCYDYNQTPRIVDIAATALAHLCVPIDPTWNLDGITRVEQDCIMVANEETAPVQKSTFVMLPNPASGTVTIQVNKTLLSGASPEAISIQSINGQVLAHFAWPSNIEHPSNTIILPLDKYANGLYIVRIHTPLGDWQEKLIINSH